MPLEPDDDDSPFAHVPASEAGPAPLQDGYFTYDKLVESTGRGTVYDASGARKLIGIIAMVLVALALLASVAATILLR
jgi:hypothetical protein